MEDDKKHCSCLSTLTSLFVTNETDLIKSHLLPTYTLKENKIILVLVVSRANSQNSCILCASEGRKCTAESDVLWISFEVNVTGI